MEGIFISLDSDGGTNEVFNLGGGWGWYWDGGRKKVQSGMVVIGYIDVEGCCIMLG